MLKGRKVIILISFIFVTILMTGLVTSAHNILNPKKEKVITITLKIDSKYMYVNGKKREIDHGRNTVPVMIKDRTMLPMRAAVEAFGGTVEWSHKEQRATFKLSGTKVELVVGKNEIYVNDNVKKIDIAPIIINDRLLFPVRYVAESFNCSVDWDEKENAVTIQKVFSDNSEQKPVKSYLKQYATVKTGPEEHFSIICDLEAGSEVGIINFEEGWYYVEFKLNDILTRGYVKKDKVICDENIPRVLYDKLSSHMTIDSKVLSGPGDEYKEIENIKELSKILYLDTINDTWAYIEFASEEGTKRGFVNIDDIVIDKIGMENIHLIKDSKVMGGPGEYYTELGNVTSTDEIALLCEENDWYYIQFNTDKGIERGYVKREEMPEDAETDHVLYSKTDGKINTDTSVKSGPSDAFASIDDIFEGSIVSILDYESSWAFIEYQKEGKLKRGYVFSMMIDCSDEGKYKNIIENECMVFSGPSTEFEGLDMLKKGKKVQALEVSDNGFVYIEYKSIYGKKRGFVAVGSVLNINAPKYQKYKIKKGMAKSRLTVESGPSSSYVDIGFLENGMVADIIEDTGEWYLIEYCSNKGAVRGYVIKRYIDTENIPEEYLTDSSKLINEQASNKNIEIENYNKQNEKNLVEIEGLKPMELSVKIIQKFISQKAGNNRKRVGENPIKAIVVHWVGYPNQDVMVTWEYLATSGKNGSSAHYIVGLNGEIVQALPDERCAFAAGGSSYTKLANQRFVDSTGRRRHNDWTLNIETATTDWKGTYTKDAYEAMVKLCAKKLNEYNLSTNNDLLRHYDITRKDCPKKFYGTENQSWEKFKNDVDKARKTGCIS